MNITDLLAAVQADLTQLQTDLNALTTALQGLDITTIQNTLQSLVDSVQTTATALTVAVRTPDSATPTLCLMANLVLSFTENTNGSRVPPADGDGVTAWNVADIIQNPQDGFYPTVGSPAASGTTTSGDCTLTGLSGLVPYWVCIVDAGTKSHWFYVGIGAAGSGVTYPFTYVPSPVAEVAPPTPGTAHLAAYMIYQYGGDFGNGHAQIFQNVYPYDSGGGDLHYRGIITVPPQHFAAGDGVLESPHTSFVTPPESVAVTLAGQMGVLVSDLTGTNWIVAHSNFTAVDFSPGGGETDAGLHGWTTDASGGSDLSFSGATLGNTAAGMYGVVFWVDLSGAVS